MDIALLKEGFFVMVIGMGTVFIFLTIMIWAMYINGAVLRVINKYFPEEVPVEKKVKSKTSGNDEEIALAIACAINASAKKVA